MHNERIYSFNDSSFFQFHAIIKIVVKFFNLDVNISISISCAKIIIFTIIKYVFIFLFEIFFLFTIKLMDLISLLIL